MPLYFIIYLFLFWVPVFVLMFVLRKKLDPITRKAFWVTWLLVNFMTFGMEYIYLKFHVWTFSQQVDPLLGINLFGVPIEEFEFWWGAAALFMLLYLFFDRLMPKRSKGS